MHNVKRIEEPDILKRKGSEWKQQYIDLIEIDSPKKSTFLQGKYNHPDIKAALEEMYGFVK